MAFRPAQRTAHILRSVRLLAVAGACSSITALTISACGSVTPPGQSAPARPAPAGFTGYDWLVVAIRHGGRDTSIPARLDVDLQFSRGGQFLADDPVNSHSGTFRVTPSGFTTSAMAVSLVGYAGHDPVILLSQNAMSAFDNGAQAATRVTADRLVVSVASYTLTCERHGPANSNL
jgi:hypothetical protein